MDDFPDFTERPENRIAASSQATPGVEGYVFEGAYGSQMHRNAAPTVDGNHRDRC